MRGPQRDAGCYDQRTGLQPRHQRRARPEVRRAADPWGSRPDHRGDHRTGNTDVGPRARRAKLVRRQIEKRVDELGCVEGSGNLDLPGSSNWYIPDIAVVPEELAKGGSALLPDQTLLIVEVTSESNAETDRGVKRRRYTEYGAPLYLLVDRVDRCVTLFSEPGELGYTRVDAPTRSGRSCVFRCRSNSTSTRAGSPDRRVPAGKVRSGEAASGGQAASPGGNRACWSSVAVRGKSRGGRPHREALFRPSGSCLVPSGSLSIVPGGTAPGVRRKALIAGS